MQNKTITKLTTDSYLVSEKVLSQFKKKIVCVNSSLKRNTGF